MLVYIEIYNIVHTSSVGNQTCPHRHFELQNTWQSIQHTIYFKSASFYKFDNIISFSCSVQIVFLVGFQNFKMTHFIYFHLFQLSLS